jgi:TolB-like protein
VKTFAKKAREFNGRDLQTAPIGQDRLTRLKVVRGDVIEPAVGANDGRIVKSTGDGAIVEFRSTVRCAVEIQSGMAERNQGIPVERCLTFRIGVHLGDVVEEDDGDLMGDSVNIASRLEGVCEAGGICLSEDAFRQVRDKVKEEFADLGELPLKNIARPMRVYQMLWGDGEPLCKVPPNPVSARMGLPGLPLIAVLPFANLSGDPEQEYFADGIVEDIITGLSRFKSFAVIARNSSFVYKGKAVNVTQVGRELGVRYVLGGGVRRSGNRLRISAQLVDSTTKLQDSHDVWPLRELPPVVAASRGHRRPCRFYVLELGDEVEASSINSRALNVVASVAYLARPWPPLLEAFVPWTGSLAASGASSTNLFGR